MADVALGSPTDGQALTFDTASGLWLPGDAAGGASALDDLTDVSAAAPADNEALTYDSASGLWVPEAVVAALDDLTDVNAPSPTDGQALVFDTASGMWVPGAATGGGATLIKKAAQETVNNSTTLQDDDHFTFEADALSYYLYTISVRINSAANADFKAAWSTPSGGIWSMLGSTAETAPTLVSIAGQTTTATPVILPCNANDEIALFWGMIKIGATAGTVTWQWAQNTAQLSDTIVRNDGVFAYWKAA
ncbi:MAG: hypothetical protein NUW01_05955 [Gemmatimonadaceae bacterium]|nr:hypothetical protein [Gemmatimonadaceae bacterium]